MGFRMSARKVDFWKFKHQAPQYRSDNIYPADEELNELLKSVHNLMIMLYRRYQVRLFLKNNVYLLFN